jgi:hypothetical protein
VPFVSDSELEKALHATDLTPPAQQAVVAENASARLIGLRSALWMVALLIVIGLFFTGMLPRRALASRPNPPLPI